MQIAHTVTVYRRTEGATDARGNEVVTYAPGGAQGIYAAAPGANEPLDQQARPEGERIDWTLYAPPSLRVEAGDRVEFAGHLYNVSGTPKDWSSGPWGWDAGKTVELTRVEG